MTNLRTPLPLYRNIVISSVSTNNNKIVLLIVLLYCYSSTLPGYAEVCKTRSDAREHSQRSDRAKTRGRDGLSGRGNSLSQGVQVPKGSRERQWGLLGDKFGSKEGNAVDKAFRQGFDEGRERGRAEGTMPGRQQSELQAETEERKGQKS